MIKIFHLLNGLIGMGIGLYCLGFAERAAKSLGISFFHPSGATDFRATYGGITLACGVFFMLAFFRVVDDRAGLWFAALFYAGLGFTRLVGILIDGGPQMTMMYVFLFLEILFFLASALFLRSFS